MLPVYLHQHRSKLAQQAGRGGLVVDKRAAAAVRLNHASDDERLAGLGVQAALGERDAGRVVRGADRS
jgi:hypothetical protein